MFLNASKEAPSSTYKMFSRIFANYNSTSTHKCANLRSLLVDNIINRFVGSCLVLMVNAHLACWLIHSPVCSSRPLSSAISCSTTEFSPAVQPTESPLYQYYRVSYSSLFTWRNVYVYFICLRHLHRALKLQGLEGSCPITLR